jgi:RND family efflux transporter MFP subunit
MTSQDVSQPDSLPTSVSTGSPPRAPRWLLIGSAGIVLLGGVFVGWRIFMARVGGPPMQMPPGVPVTLDTVQTGAVQDSSEFIGSLDAQAGATLQPEVGGRVAAIYVSAGDRVTAGTPILVVSPDQAAAEVNAAAANIGAAQAARNSAAAQLRSLQARRSELEANLALAQEEYERSLYLVEQGALSQQTLDIDARDLEVAQAGLAAAQQEIAAAQANLTQADASLGQATANRDAAQEALATRTVIAPFDGIVGDINVKLGEYVSPTTVVTTITENARLELDLEVPIAERDRLSLGLPVELLTSGSDEVLTRGSITFISPQADAATQTLLVKAGFNNAAGRLRDAERVDARIIWSQEPGVLVPTSAITRLGGQTFVYIADEGSEEELPPPQALPPDMPPVTQVARLRPVQLGDIQGNNYAVLDGLQAGETIVVSGILNLQDGTPIIPQDPNAAPAGPNGPPQ